MCTLTPERGQVSTSGSKRKKSRRHLQSLRNDQLVTDGRTEEDENHLGNFGEFLWLFLERLIYSHCYRKSFFLQFGIYL